MENFLNFIQLLSLIIIIGGTVTIGALVAPIVFRSLSKEESGMLMMELFTSFDKWLKFSAILLLIAKIMELAIVHKMSFMVESSSGEELIRVLNSDLVSSFLLTLLIVALSFYLSFKLSPAISSSYENDSPEFSKLHRQSEMLHKINFLLAIFLLFSFA